MTDAQIKALIAALEECTDVLCECESYMDNRADADCDQDGFIPNEEMRLLNDVSRALNRALPLLPQKEPTP